MNKAQHQKILQSVEKKFERGKSHQWKNKDFSDLSFEIHLKTKTLISPATLKRLFGKVKISENYSPQENTIQALKDYSGYIKSSTSKKLKLKWIYSGIAVIIVIALLIWMLIPEKKEEANSIPEIGELKLTKVEGTCPTTAFFEITKPQSNGQITFDFGDESKPVRILNHKRQSHFYAYPGNFNAVLRDSLKRVSNNVKVFVPSDGWQSFAHYMEKEENKRYFPVPLGQNQKNSIFHASPKSLYSLGIDTTQIVVIRIDNYHKTKHKGDSFTYQSRFRNSSFWPAIRCYSVYITVEGTNGKIEFKFVGEGCSAYSHYTLSEKNKSGAFNDLSNFTVDQQKWLDVTVTNENKQVSVNLNDQLVFSDSYQRSIGEIIGTSMIFHGSGSVDYIYLTSGDGKTVMGTDFGD